jgi:hypothetical protein
MVKEDINTECKLFDELQDYEALPPCFQDCLDFLFINLSRPYEDNLDSWGKVISIYVLADLSLFPKINDIGFTCILPMACKSVRGQTILVCSGHE